MDRKVYEHIYKQTGEKIIEWKKCSCSEEFPITDKDLEFYEKISPSFPSPRVERGGGEGKMVKYSIPSPTLCPDCRQQKRLTWRNERKLFKRKSDLSGKNIIGMYSEESKFKVYALDEWWSDNWNPMDYGKDFDFSRTFMEQFSELLLDTPQPNLSVLNMENSDYNNQAGSLKNCYLMFNSNFDENCAYGKGVNYSVNAYDSYKCYGLQNTYECIDCHDSYKLYYSQQCVNCNDSYFLYDCKNCKNCYGCKNINGKANMFFNEQLTEEEYNKKLIIQLEKTISEQKKQTNNFYVNFPIKSIFSYNSTGVFGNYFTNSYNAAFSYDLDKIENSKYIIDCYESNNLMDISYFGLNSSYSYDCTTLGLDSSKVLFCVDCWQNVRDLMYCVSCTSNSSNLFGCVGLRNKEYCILNKQYSKEEYEKLVSKIIEHMKKTGEWGGFLSPLISLFSYNETVANEYYTLSKQEVINNGFKWSDYEAPFPNVKKTIPADKLPNNIKNIPDDILNWAIECEVSKKPFRIVKPELEFYRKHGLPIPKRHPDIRHMDRVNKRGSRKLFLRNCDKCGIEMVSVYNKDSEYKVYCEECYNKEVI